jgi:hypothetical protein
MLIGFGEQPLDRRALYVVQIELQHLLVMSDVHSDDDGFFRHRRNNGIGSGAGHLADGSGSADSAWGPLFGVDVFLVISTPVR